MSTTYILRKPLSLAEVTRRSGYYAKRYSAGWALTNGYCVLWPDWSLSEEPSANAIITGFERYGCNEGWELAECTDAVSEHDDEDPDYERLFG